MPKTTTQPAAVRPKRKRARTRFVLVHNKHYGIIAWWKRGQGDRIENRAGGWCLLDSTDGDMEVLEECEGTWSTLDYSRTSLAKPQSDDAGWLDRDGKFYPCESAAHDAYAHLILKTTTGTLERKGWVRVLSRPTEQNDRRFICEKRMTAQQRNFLSGRGYRLYDFD